MCYGMNSSLGNPRPAPLGGGRFVLWRSPDGPGDRFGIHPDASTQPDFRLFRLLCACFSLLFRLFLASAGFSSAFQSLAL